MVETGSEALERLLVALRQDAEARSGELERLNQQLEERNSLLQKQLEKRVSGARWLALLGMLMALIVGAWVYTLVLKLGNDMQDMSGQMRHMHGYMQNMAAGEPVQGQASYLSSMAHDIHQMSADISAMRDEMTQVSGDIGVMRVAMTDMRGDIGSMNTAMTSMGSDMGDMRENISGMAQSLGSMNRNVGRLSRDAQNLREPFRGMMPW